MKVCHENGCRGLIKFGSHWSKSTLFLAKVGAIKYFLNCLQKFAGHKFMPALL